MLKILKLLLKKESTNCNFDKSKIHSMLKILKYLVIFKINSFYFLKGIVCNQGSSLARLFAQIENETEKKRNL